MSGLQSPVYNQDVAIENADPLHGVAADPAVEGGNRVLYEVFIEVQALVQIVIGGAGKARRDAAHVQRGDKGFPGLGPGDTLNFHGCDPDYITGWIYSYSMCTNFALIKRDGTTQLAEQLGVNEDDFLFGNDMGPGSTISIVVDREGAHRVQAATWWLYLQQTAQGLKPHKDYFSVNTRYDKLAKKPEYKKRRCIVPASVIVESQNGKHPHLLEPADGSAFALGGLWKEWRDEATGELVYSASIITLPGHPALENIHRKSIPMWLPEDAYDQWLAEDITDPRVFEDLLTPVIRTPLKATLVDRARSKQPVAAPFVIKGGT